MSAIRIFRCAGQFAAAAAITTVLLASTLAGPDAEAPELRGLVRHRGPPARVRGSQYSEIPLDPLVTWGTLLSLGPYFPLIRPAERLPRLR